MFDFSAGGLFEGGGLIRAGGLFEDIRYESETSTVMFVQLYMKNPFNK